MQLVSVRAETLRPRITATALKTVLILFGVMVVLSYAYVQFVDLTLGRLRAIQVVLPLIVTMVPFVLGWLIDKKQPGQPIALFFLIMAYSTAVGGILQAIGYLNEAYPSSYTPQIDSILMVSGSVL